MTFGGFNFWVSFKKHDLFCSNYGLFIWEVCYTEVPNLVTSLQEVVWDIHSQNKECLIFTPSGNNYTISKKLKITTSLHTIHQYTYAHRSFYPIISKITILGVKRLMSTSVCDFLTLWVTKFWIMAQFIFYRSSKNLLAYKSKFLFWWAIQIQSSFQRFFKNFFFVKSIST